MKKVFKEFIEKFAEDFTCEERENTKYIKGQIREAADEEPGFESMVFKLGASIMAKRIAKCDQRDIDWTQVDEKEAIRLLQGLTLRDIHAFFNDDGVPEGKVCVFSTIEEKEETSKFRVLLIYDYGELRISNFY